MSIRNSLYRFSWKWEKRIVPGHTSAQNVYCRLLKQHLPQQPIWLDLGCGHQLFPDWLNEEEMEMIRWSKQLVGIDLDHPSLLKHSGLRDKVEGSLAALPFRTESFDLVTANMVVEHLSDPDGILREIHGILKSGGLFVFHTPNYLNFKIFLASLLPQVVKNRLILFFEERREEDVFPTFYRMNTPAQVRQRSARAGFEVVNLTLTDSSATTVMLGPVVILELLWFKFCRWQRLQNLRTSMIVILRKP